MTSEYSYGRAARDSARESGVSWAEMTEIPFPGLVAPRSQIAVPILAGTRLVGVLFAESAQDMRFRYDEEDALATIAAQLGAMMAALHPPAPLEEVGVHKQAAVQPSGTPAVVRHYAADGSVFINNDYLIKGVAGAILWKLLRDFMHHGRTDFSNRELRLSGEIVLPDLSANLEARLILLKRRLAERCSFVRLEKTGRGRFSLLVTRPLVLEEVLRNAVR